MAQALSVHAHTKHNIWHTMYSGETQLFSLRSKVAIFFRTRRNRLSFFKGTTEGLSMEDQMSDLVIGNTERLNYLICRTFHQWVISLFLPNKESKEKKGHEICTDMTKHNNYKYQKPYSFRDDNQVFL